MDDAPVWLVFPTVPPRLVSFTHNYYMPPGCLTWTRTFEAANECISRHAKNPAYENAMAYEYRPHFTGRWELVDDS